jgi:uncharacterized protein with ParB-like and HNH nuclease domain
MKEYRITWVHEVLIEAENDDDARDIWEEINIHDIDGDFESGEKSLLTAGFVEDRSFECVTDDYRDVKIRKAK